MRFIPVDVHNIMNYLYGILIIVSPWLFDFNRGGAETVIPIVVGIVVLGISLATNYKYSLAKIISFKAHLTADIVIGIFLIVSPWLFGFNNYVYIPHAAFGLIAVMTSLMTERRVAYKAY